MVFFYSDMLHFDPVTSRLAAVITTGKVCAGAIGHIGVITHHCADVMGETLKLPE